MHEEDGFAGHGARLPRQLRRFHAVRTMGIIWVHKTRAFLKKIAAAPLPDRETDIALPLDCRRDAKVSNVAQSAMRMIGRPGFDRSTKKAAREETT